MTTIIHISDLHSKIAQVERLFTAIATRHPGAVVCITGDITDSGLPDQYKAMANALKILAGCTVLGVPGNHDYAVLGNFEREESVFILWPRLKKLFSWNMHFTDTRLEGWASDDEQIVIYGLDTADPFDAVVSARGIITPDQIDQLKLWLNFAKQFMKFRVVIFHHHLFTHNYFTELVGAPALLQALSGHCDLVLFGHDGHFGLWRDYKGIPVISASHNNADLFGSNFLYSVFEVEGTTIRHRLEVI